MATKNDALYNALYDAGTDPAKVLAALGPLLVAIAPASAPGTGENGTGPLPTPGPGGGRETTAKVALARLLETGVDWRGEWMLRTPAALLNARRKIEAWGGDVLDVELVQSFQGEGGRGLHAPAFAEHMGRARMLSEAIDRWAELQAAPTDMRHYVLALAPAAGFTLLDPEGPIEMNVAPLRAGSMPTSSLQEYIKGQLDIEASGGKPSGM